MLIEFFFVDTPANSDKENSINFILYESRNIYNLYKNLSSALFHLQFNHVPFCIKKSSLLQTGMQLLNWALLKRLYDTETREKTISTKNLQN